MKVNKYYCLNYKDFYFSYKLEKKVKGEVKLTLKH